MGGDPAGAGAGGRGTGQRQQPVTGPSDAGASRPASRHRWGRLRHGKTAKLNGSGVQKAAESWPPGLQTIFLGIRKDFLGTDTGQFVLRFDSLVSPRRSGVSRDNSRCSQQSRGLLLPLFQVNTDLPDHPP